MFDSDHVVFKNKLQFSVSIKTPNIFNEIWFKNLKELWISIKHLN